MQVIQCLSFSLGLICSEFVAIVTNPRKKAFFVCVHVVMCRNSRLTLISVTQKQLIRLETDDKETLVVKEQFSCRL